MLSDIPFAICLPSAPHLIIRFRAEPRRAATPRLAVAENATQRETMIASIRQSINGICAETLQAGIIFFIRDDQKLNLSVSVILRAPRARFGVSKRLEEST